MKTTRRVFLKNTYLFGAGAIILPSIVLASVFGKGSPSNRINITVIGCGHQTVSQKIPQLLASHHAQIVAVSDVDSWCLNKAQLQVNDYYSKQKGITYNGFKIFDNYRNVIVNKNIDAVMIASPYQLNYDMWLEPAWEVPYTEKRVHALKAYGRPDWMRVDSYSNGMISNWCAHQMGIAQWGTISEYTGPVLIECRGTLDKGIWNTMNSFSIKYNYANGVELFFKMERPYVRFEGTEGWIEIEYPDKLTASSQAILDSTIGENEMKIEHLLLDKEDFCNAVKTGKQSLELLVTAHRTISMCQLGLSAIKNCSKLTWDPEKEEINGDNAASALLNISIKKK